jgi:nucleoside-diphosphate-sugar epimerase
LKALVTGAGGFLGRYLIAELERRGDSIAALVRPSSGSIAALETRDVAVVECDLRRPPADFAAELEPFDAIFHLAAGVGPGWRATFESNFTATERLLDAIDTASWHGRFVHVSSFAVYGVNQLPRGAVVDEETPLEPHPGKRDDYAWTKLLQEQLVRERLGAAATGVELAIVRPGAIYGPERKFQYRLGRPLGEHSVLLLGGGNTMPLSYVENTASLIAECGHRDAAAGQVFNAVDPEPVTQRQYLRAWRRAEPELRVLTFPLWAYRGIGRALQALGRRTRRVEAPLFLDPYVMEPSLRRMRYDSSRAKALLDWDPPVSTPEALRRTFSSKSAS